MTTASTTTCPLSRPDALFIGGEWVSPEGGKTGEVTISATGETFFHAADASAADVGRAVGAAREAFDNGPWPSLSHDERAAYMRKMADILTERAPQVSAMWSNEMGILQSHAGPQASAVAGIFKYYASVGKRFAFEEEHRTFSGAKLGLLTYEPVGVVGAIVPWNAPMILLAFKLAPALIAGCTVVVKASPEAPGQPLLMAEVAEAAGLPPGVINVVVSDREASEALVTDPRVDKIAFTGSTSAGLRIAGILGSRMARYTMELGGKSAAIVLDDYDVGLAAKALAAQALVQTGQVCAALTRVIVTRSRQDQLADALAAEFAGTRIGDPFLGDTQMGPLATEAQRGRVEAHIARARSDGYRLVTGGGRPAGLNRGYFVEPTVFADVPNSGAIASEEVFGPVLSIVPIDSEDQAVAVANDSRYGLAGAVFTNDADRAYRVCRQVRTGTMSHNAMYTDFTIAFGGFKQSGIGREGGVEGLRPYLEAKTILMDAIPSHRQPPE